MTTKAVRSRAKYIEELLTSLNKDGIDSPALNEFLERELGRAWKAGYEFNQLKNGNNGQLFNRRKEVPKCN